MCSRATQSSPRARTTSVGDRFTTGNQNAVKHGYYSQDVDSAEIRALYDAAGDVDLDQEAILAASNMILCG